ncbi:hypothetical protein AKJ09_10039 [Labilithrix luteola]|uniref:NIF system FeS cluster assembly NifU C-terminal domain-containing protein n=1 Tax=Labilithrix luteola TaxID=1391654 RepID=A0A0K1QC67_9BACT|nr:NifU family protein [Labilithrix luteola]AKV03376.1 hypothetical protein AKJ09_10039 [Labilithrix luteola]
MSQTSQADLEHELDDAGERIAHALAELRQTASPEIASKVEHLVSDIVGLYGEALARVVSALAGETTEAARSTLVRDPLVGALLVLHDLHPDDLEARIQRALDGVRPYLGSHGGAISLLGVDEGATVRLRFEGSCDGCSSSAETATDLVERAITEAAPEIVQVVFEGLADKAPTHAPPPDKLVQIGRPRDAGTNGKAARKDTLP